MTRPEPSTRLRQIGLLTAIPSVLLVGPAVGYYLGALVERAWAVAPWGISVGSVVGLLASARVTWQLIHQAERINSHE